MYRLLGVGRLRIDPGRLAEALDATGTPSVNPLKVAIALDDAELTQPGFLRQ